MALPLFIPTVTNDDLTTYHQHAFGTAPPPQSLLHFPTSPVNDTPISHHAHHIAETNDDDDDDDDDDLGFYHNGEKRTLTDAQIAMFRHSEIYALIRARQVRRENAEFDDGESFVEKIEEASSASKDMSRAREEDEEEETRVSAGTGRVGEGGSRNKRRKMNRRRGMGDGGGGGGVPSRRVIREMDKPVGGGEEEEGELDY